MNDASTSLRPDAIMPHSGTKKELPDVVLNVPIVATQGREASQLNGELCIIPLLKKTQDLANHLGALLKD